MRILRALRRLFTVPGAGTGPFMEVVVRCARCGEVIHGRIHLYNDLSAQDDGDITAYFCRRGLVGSGANRCFNPIIVEYTFDANRMVTERRIQGGQFVDEGV